MTVLLTGASGFVGRRLGTALSNAGKRVRVVSRHPIPIGDDCAIIPSIDSRTDWLRAVEGVSTVVHLAARVHVMGKEPGDALERYREVNLRGTLRLAEQAAQVGVKRLVYLSTIKVNGETTNGVPFRASDLPHPKDPYSVSKWEAETGLRSLSERTGLELVTVRPPLIYGPGVKGNMLRLLQWIDRGIPLPFANADNRRSLLSLENLVDFIIRCLEHPSAAGETFLVADDCEVSMSDLIRGLATGMRKQSRMVPIPKRMMRKLLEVSGKSALWSRLWGDLQVDVSKAREVLDWRPPQGTVQALEQVGAWYREQPKSIRV